MLYKDQWHKHNYETLIAPALFKTCQDIMHGRKPEEPKHFKTTEKPFIFRGLITCGECGCMISSDRKIKPSGKNTFTSNVRISRETARIRKLMKTLFYSKLKMS